MRINDALVLDMLRTNNKVNEEQIKNLLDAQRTDKKPLQDIVIASNIITE